MLHYFLQNPLFPHTQAVYYWLSQPPTRRHSPPQNLTSFPPRFARLSQASQAFPHPLYFACFIVLFFGHQNNGEYFSGTHVSCQHIKGPEYSGRRAEITATKGPYLTTKAALFWHLDYQVVATPVSFHQNQSAQLSVFYFRNIPVSDNDSLHNPTLQWLKRTVFSLVSKLRMSSPYTVLHSTWYPSTSSA